jgi:DNA-binding NarL/FixJ family response regulator
MFASSKLKSMQTHSLPLSEREREVLGLISKGFSTSEISSYLSISKQTVETHRKNMLRKTGASSIIPIVRIALINGIIQ